MTVRYYVSNVLPLFFQYLQQHSDKPRVAFLSKITAMSGPTTAMSSLSISKYRWINYVLFTCLHIIYDSYKTITELGHSVSAIGYMRSWRNSVMPSADGTIQNKMAYAITRILGRFTTETRRSYYAVCHYVISLVFRTTVNIIITIRW